ncbi:PQQ-binding-like beta-propeller repeat protein [Streptomyces sp. Isolate_45]|uniref:outer membrane protein assembly factor BamB family protein n=1 Tax=Streptomyces sp. Isolate_45 TaxID=2950111 RepID=UPI002482102C|nr:PQQ-binding-like beta-propeller repeat protein [Streptomyces sp. Isolate_45]MDA5286353.1 PQQ-binding-like beta-propeller repeat protein [Streptomyces sp. Isolate_45]
MERGNPGAGLLPEDPRVAGPYRLLARWPGPRPDPPHHGMYVGRNRDHGHAVVCLLPPAAYPAAETLRRAPVPGVPAVLGLRTGTVPSWAALAYTPAVSLADVAGRPGRGAGVLSLDRSVGIAGEVAATLAALHARGIGYGAVAPEGVWLTTGRPLLMALHACRTLSEPGGGPGPEPEPVREREEASVPEREDASGPGPEPLPDAAPDPDGRPRRRAVGAAPRAEPQSRVSTVPAAFMAPEVAAGRPSSAAADVYGLAVLLIHTATGGLPFGDGPPPVLAYRALHDRPELPALPGELGRAVAAALAPAPADRPTAAELHRAMALHGLETVRQVTDGQERAGQEDPPPAGPLPGRVVAALAVRAQEIADLETETRDADAPPTDAPYTDTPDPDDRRRADGPASTDEASPRGRAPGPVGGPHPEPDGGRDADPYEHPHGAPPPPGAEGSHTPAAPPPRPAPTRRRLLTHLLAGAALGASGTLAWSVLTRDDGRTGPPSGAGAATGTSPRVPGMPPPALWRFDDNTARTRLLPVSGADRFLMLRGDVLYGHDLRTGKEVWQMPGVSGNDPPVQVPGDRFLVTTREGMSLRSLGEGRAQWLQRSENLSGVLAVEGATAWLVVGDGNPSGGHLLAAFDLDRRKELWRTPLPAGFAYRLAAFVGPRTVVVEVTVPPQELFRDVTAVRTLAIAGYDRNGGRMLWNRTFRDVDTGPASAVDPADGGRLFLLSRGHAQAYDLESGTRLWESQAVVAGTNAQPLLAGGTLYLTDDGRGPIVAVAPDTGRTLWTQSLDEDLEWSMLGRMVASASGRTLYLSTLNQVTATSLPSGKRLWQAGLAGVEAREPFQLVATPNVLLVARPSVVVALPTD